MRVSNIATAVAVALWFGMFLTGLGLTADLADRLGGSIALGQFDYYVLVPAFMIIGLLACAWVFNMFRRAYVVLGVLSGLSLVVLLLFLFPYSGGV